MSEGSPFREATGIYEGLNMLQRWDHSIRLRKHEEDPESTYGGSDKIEKCINDTQEDYPCEVQVERATISRGGVKVNSSERGNRL